jgi:8-oxo-dGTP pyrophosphatase MutT (NUDIX family)
MPGRFRGRNALVTGASRGIGAALAERLAAEGANVALVARTVDAHDHLAGSLGETLARCRRHGARAEAIAADLADADSRAAVVPRALELFGGRIDVLVNIPGGMVEPGESPRAACARELREELGLDLEPGRLLVTDWAPKRGHDRMLFVFDGGTLTAEQLAAITLPPDELASWAFVPPADLGGRLVARLVRRVEAALAARAAGASWYLEHGVRVP